VSASILVIDDDTSIRETLVEFFGTFRWTAIGAGSAAAARVALSSNPPDVVLLDLRLPDSDGVRFLDALRLEWPDIAVIVLTGHADVQTAVRSMQRGALDLLEKPVDLDVLAATVRRALALGRLKGEVEVLRARHSAPADWATTVAPAVEESILQAALTDQPVLLVGEPGTGRRDLGRLLHRSSTRAGSPFVDIDCTVHSAESFADELYGSFGQGRAARRGLLEVAAEGTVLITTLETLAESARSRLHMLLEDNSFQRFAQGRPLIASARLVATVASNHGESAANTGSAPWWNCRRALVIEVPALRYRTDDLPRLARALLPAGATLTDDAIEAIRRYAWPGNLRELRFVLWRASLLAPREPISASHLSLPEPRATSLRPLHAVERDAIRAALHSAGGNRSQAARALGIARSTLHLKLASLELSDNRTESQS
jgi:DNA-binding NtrC family response regulator